MEIESIFLIFFYIITMIFYFIIYRKNIRKSREEKRERETKPTESKLDEYLEERAIRKGVVPYKIGKGIGKKEETDDEKE